ncbi:hypothetical protein EJB01_05875 [Klebsiella pneumoniae]|nr:hypothetical protein EJB01_05875 [Klebsiella pneumoniae]
MRDLILQLSKSSIYSTKPQTLCSCGKPEDLASGFPHSWITLMISSISCWHRSSLSHLTTLISFFPLCS